MEYVVKYSGAKEAVEYNIRRCRKMRLECWITKATDTSSECVIQSFCANNCLANGISLYFTSALPLFFSNMLTHHLVRTLHSHQQHAAVMYTVYGCVTWL